MKKIYLIDGSSFIYRMFFALPEFSTTSGEVVNAVFGIAKLFLNQFVKENPDYIIFVKDAKGENFRHQIYKDYKATRDKMPDNLKSQMSLIDKLLLSLNIKSIEKPGFEADDIIGTLATLLGQNNDFEVFILSGDKDLFSLTTKNVKIYDTQKQKIYDDIEAQKKFEIPSKYIIDYLSIVGDMSDNIPGIPGFGPRKAISLINTYGSLEEIYNHIDDRDFIITKKNLDILKENKEIAFLSKKLATIDKNVNLKNFFLEDYKFSKNNLLNDNSKEFFTKYEFYSLYKEEKKLKTWDELNLNVNLITNDLDLEKLFDKIKLFKEIVLDTETTSLQVMQANLVGVSIFLDEKNIYYINFGHIGDKVSNKGLKDFFTNLFLLDIKIIGHNLKYDLEIIQNFLNKNEENIFLEDKLQMGFGF
ncbi:hypothetical protein H3C61_03835 [Candidatus Gracilibacteria bacterium]|nr:hypothetical protein [Candidatus Gracilibacteria bacterium]